MQALTSSKYRVLLIASAVFILFTANPSFAEKDCIGCHINPKYKKEDINRLKECLKCHTTAGHPYKETPKSSTTATAEAGDKIHHVDKNKLPQKPFLKDMAYIPGGEFLMGSNDRFRDEKPLYVSYIEAFYIDIYEVTNEDYKKFVDAAGSPPPDNWIKNNYPKGKGKHPVIYVTWHDAVNYCRWKGKRLPREAEWEKAARTTDGRTYPWGDNWDLNKSNNPLRGNEDTMPVGSFENGKNPYGLYDMSGNVWEWVDDDYFSHPGSDYANPVFGKNYKLLKGGSWWDCSFYGCGISAPAFNRSFFDPATKNDSFGFRCAADTK